MLGATLHEIKKALLTLQLENILLDIGPEAYEDVTNRLANRFGCYLPDCYEKPEYLCAVLDDISNGARPLVSRVMKSYLSDYFEKEPLANMLKKILVNPQCN